MFALPCRVWQARYSLSVTSNGGAVSESGRIDLDTARELERESPAKALEWLRSQPESSARAEAIAGIATDWATRNPAAAMTWVETVAPAEIRGEAMLRVFNRWTDRDAGAVLRWAASRGPSAGLDSMLWYFATDTTLRYVAREKALAGAAMIAEPELRGEALGHVVLIWARREPGAAMHYVKECTSLSTAQKELLVQKIGAMKR
jgi:hypothetical protein